MEIWVLGTFEVSHDGRPVDVRGALPRRLLALLALTPGRELSAARIIEGLWGEDAPSAAPSTLQSHVARLRRDLPVPGALRTGRHGYALDIADEDVDAIRFERDVARGASALVAGRLEESSAVLTGALELWRGTPYAEFSGCSPLEIESDRLANVRLDALEQRISADLGRPGVAPPTAELEALVRWHPLRESFWALLMAAQYRAGRQADALASYQRARTVLSEDLGIDPGPALQELERLVLAQDPSLESAGMSSFLPTPGQGEPYSRDVALLERDELLGTLASVHEQARSGSGQLVLVHGEAGAGKSALVQAFARTAATVSPVLRGACDPLSSPRPLGPLIDLAPHLDPVVGELVRSGRRDGLFERTMSALEALGPAVVVLEDLQWADMSTLDLIRFLARRLEGTNLLVVTTYRDDDLPGTHPLRVMLGDIASRPVVLRVAVPALSRAAVGELVRSSGLDADEVFRETAGNAFFVTEVVASGGAVLPPTVQDAVLARTHRLSPQARLALDSAAVIGSRIEPSVIHGMPDVSPDAVDECVTAGLLRFDAPIYSFRHELVRQSVLSGIAPGRLGALHWQALDRLRSIPMSPKPFARLAEHAEMAGDPQAILEYAVAAGDFAASLGSHREAAFQYGRAIPYADLLDIDARLRLLRGRATECNVADQIHASISAWEHAIALLRGTDRTLELGSALMAISHSQYVIGNTAASKTYEDEGIALLETLSPGEELALAYAYRAGSFMVANAYLEAIEWVHRTVALADEVGSVAAKAQALNSWGCSACGLGDPDGERLLRDSLALASAHGLVAITSRGYTNLAFVLDQMRRYDDSLEVLEQGIRFSEEHDLHSSLLCTMASHATLSASKGYWDEAVAEANDLLYVRETSRVSRMEPLITLALVGARRGDRDDIWALLDEAKDVVSLAGHVQYDVPCAIARAEVLLIQGDLDAAEAELRPAYDEATELGSDTYAAQVALWLWRIGRLGVWPCPGGGPESLSVAGRPREAAALWHDYGFPCDEAWALLDSDEEVDIREARALFDRLGATVLVARCDEKLRSIGAKVPRGARASTRANVGGLTDRETDVLQLLDEGLRNADIAARLHLSEKTVGHHVSAILAKLGASSRTEAVRRARDLAATG